MITLAELHTQVNLDQNYTDDDDYLLALLAACVVAVKNRIFDTTKNDITEPIEGDLEGENSNAPLRQAVLLLIANFYANREPVAYVQTYTVPYTFDFLIAPYINY